MNIYQKILWNKERAEKEGWDASLFDCDEIDAHFVNAVVAFQKEHGLTADGLCGSNTARRKYSEDLQEEAEMHLTPGSEYIIYNGTKVKIYWDKVVTYDENPKIAAYSKGRRSFDGLREPIMFVTHWDVTLSSGHCLRILEKRGLAVHFLIENDGHIIQTCDMNDIAYHAGSRTLNACTVGVEISNAYDLKWQDWYVKKGFGPRPIVKGARVHGKRMSDHLGFYSQQELALAALWEAVSYACNIPLELPETQDALDPKASKAQFKGFVNHYHLTTRKIDCGGLDNDTILKWAKEIRQERLEDMK